MPSKPLCTPWAVLFNGKLSAFGIGNLFHFPIFDTQKEARAWVRERQHWQCKLRIVRVEVRLAEE